MAPLLVLLLCTPLVTCYVLDLHNSLSLVITVDPDPVRVELYYESLCPGCRNFLTTGLYPAWDKLRDTGLLEVAVYPYGNAHQTQNKDGSWNFTCQHDKPECDGNLIEVCIMAHSHWDSSSYLPVISCMEAADDPLEAAPGCVTQLSQLTWDEVKICAEGTEGNRLEHGMGAKTDSLQPPHTFVPWIVVDGEHSEELQRRAMEDLVGLVCSLYKGPKPKQCKKEVPQHWQFIFDFMNSTQTN